MRKAEQPLQIDMPPQNDDNPPWSKIGIIAIVGFGLGVFLPKIFGFEVGPSVPNDSKSEPLPVTSISHKPETKTTNSPSNATPVDTSELTQFNRQKVKIQQGKIRKCYDDKNKKMADCGPLNLDSAVIPQMEKLSICPAVLGLDGEAKIIIDVDFIKSSVSSSLEKGENNIPSSTIQGILDCLNKSLPKSDLSIVPHSLAKYSVAYTLNFFPPGKKFEDNQNSDKESFTNEETSKIAIVSWETAPLRKSPKNKEIIERLVKGTKVKILEHQKDWYKVESRSKTGWIYRGAIGL